jgi:hypothetical protein
MLRPNEVPPWAKRRMFVGRTRIGRDWAEPITVLHLGDHDPSGVHCFFALDEDVVAFAEHYGGDIEFIRLAVTEAQAQQYELPSAPAKETDRRAASTAMRRGSSRRWIRAPWAKSSAPPSRRDSTVSFSIRCSPRRRKSGVPCFLDSVCNAPAGGAGGRRPDGYRPRGAAWYGTQRASARSNPRGGATAKPTSIPADP